MMHATLAVAAVLAVQPAQDPTHVLLTEGARSPAYAGDGRLAISLRGDLWLIPPGGGDAIRVTDGPAWDRAPAWSTDGRWLVFASDRADGNLDVWRVAVDARGVAGSPERLTTSAAADDEPSPAAGGDIIFVRGSFASADLWLRRADGSETRLTTEAGAELSPAVDAAGGRVAYIAVRDGTRTLRVARLDGTVLRDDVTLHEGRSAAHPSFSPDGSRIVLTVSGRDDAGTFVTDVAGTWLLRASPIAGHATWAPDGAALAIANVDNPDAGYNGDPDRVGDRSAGDVHARAGGTLRRVRVPTWPDSEPDTIPLLARIPHRDYNADAFDRVWTRVARTYFDTMAAARAAGDGARALAEWTAARERHRPRALAATSQPQLEDALHALLAERPHLRAAREGRAGVSSAHPLATAAGVEILEAGGNVVDAAIAVSFALGVVEPDASGIGGYGEMVLSLETMAEPIAIEFMTRVPEHAGLDNAALDDLPPDGPLLALVPGPVAGMGLAFERYGSGRVTWAQILAPAIRIAEHGFVLDDAFPTTLAREREAFARYESSRTLFFGVDGEPLRAGDTLRNPDLAWTLREIAQDGWRAFYTGAPAERLVNDLRKYGHPITMQDMARYFAKERTPVKTTYRGHTIYSGPPPVTGGVVLAAKLNLLELAPRGGAMVQDAAKLHAMIEAWKLQPSTAGRIADPDSWPTDIRPFESKDTARVRWQCFDPARASSPAACERRAATEQRDDDGTEPALGATSSEQDDATPRRATGTTAFAVADADGNMVAVTQTLGTWGGNFYVTPGLGFLYNDKMRSHGTDPDRYNARIPYARTGTVIAPTLVFRGTDDDRVPLMAVGAAGNAWITSAVYQAVVGVIDDGLTAQQALELPRFLPGGGAITIEAGFSPSAIRRLEQMGHRFNRISLDGEVRMGYGAAVVIRDGRVDVGADPRRSGAAGAAARRE
jgi:gamma-glutamyltranspeptidase